MLPQPFVPVFSALESLEAKSKVAAAEASYGSDELASVPRRANGGQVNVGITRIELRSQKNHRTCEFKTK